METNDKKLEMLIKNITSEVVSAVMFKPGGLASVKDFSDADKKLLLILFPELCGNLDEYIISIKSRHPEYELVIGIPGKMDLPGIEYTKEVIDINDVSSRQKLSMMVQRFDAVYLVNPEISQLKAINDGDDKGYTEKLVICRLLHGKDICIILDYDIMCIPQGGLTKKVKELFESLKGMGVSISLLRDCIEKENNKSVSRGKTLITEKDIEDMYSSGIRTVAAGKESIITPLARDKANELKIKII